MTALEDVRSSSTFLYRDKSFGDSSSIVVATQRNVFYPTSTTALLLRAARNSLQMMPQSILDLGCGCGIVGIVLAKLTPTVTGLCASDISKAAVQLTQYNSNLNGVKVDCRHGSLFEPWQGWKFDLIVDDVSAVADPIANISKWYNPPITNDAGYDGARWILHILSEAPKFLSAQGQIFFPILSLSTEAKILEAAHKTFRDVKLQQQQWYPLDDTLMAAFDLVLRLHNEGTIGIKKIGSRWCWSSKIYSAGSPATNEFDFSPSSPTCPAGSPSG